MQIRFAFACLLAFGLAAILPAAVPPAATPPTDPPPTAPAPHPRRDAVAELVDKLNARIDDPIQPNELTAADYIAKLAKAHGIEIVLDVAGFKAIGVLNSAEEKLSFHAPKGVRLHALLGMVCSHLQVSNWEAGPPEDRRGVFIRDGRIVLTSRQEVQARQHVPLEIEEDRDWPLRTTVWVIATDEPLSAVLRRIAEAYEVNIVVSSRAAKLAGTRITSRLLNAPLGTAVRSLADQCELSVFVRHNVILITTPEETKTLKQDQDWLEARREVESKTWAAERAGLEKLGKLPAGIVVIKQRLVDPTVDERVNVDARNTPLRQIIANLTGAGFNITIDPAVGIKADAEVTAKLKGVACESAVKQLAELAGVRAVRMDNSLLITTPEKADLLAPPHPNRMKEP